MCIRDSYYAVQKARDENIQIEYKPEDLEVIRRGTVDFPVSYTHLDVYKRQIIIRIVIAKSELNLFIASRDYSIFF